MQYAKKSEENKMAALDLYFTFHETIILYPACQYCLLRNGT